MTVAKCANPDCEAEFRRLGTGKLYVKNLKKTAGPAGSNQRAAWLCNGCIDSGYDLWYDRKSESFHVHRKKAA